jgi:putative DNA primase/helicase
MATSTRSARRRVAEDRRRIVLEAARGFLERGWKPLPIPTGQKRPTNLNWQLREITLLNYQKEFRLWHGNIGLQHGLVSNGLCDVDLDAREARAVAHHFLPATAATFGRKSAPASHWLYYSDMHKTAKAAVTIFDDPIGPIDGNAGEHGRRLLELRSGRSGDDGEPIGAQSMAPPSLHPSGETVRWQSDGEPARIDGANLKAAVAITAASALLTRYYPPAGQRREAASMLGGWLASLGWGEEQIANFMRVIAETAGDCECQARINSARSAARRLVDGEHDDGWPCMGAVFDKGVVDALTRWLA